MFLYTTLFSKLIQKQIGYILLNAHHILSFHHSGDKKKIVFIIQYKKTLKNRGII